MKENIAGKAAVSKSNYEKMKEQMQLKFLEYDQERMIKKFQLKSDEEYIYIRFVGQDYRINRSCGLVEGSDDGFQNCKKADYNEAMSIYDVLCYSKEDCCLSGHFCGPNQLKGTVKSASVGSALYYHESRYFDHKTESFCRACERLGGVKEKVGDVAYLLHPFEFLPMMLQFWNSDEDFPANLKVMWDENVIDFVHYETTYFILGHVLRRIKEIMEEGGKCNGEEGC